MQARIDTHSTSARQNDWDAQGCDNQGFAFGERVIGFQFHLESTLDSARELIKHYSDEIETAPYIQTAEEMLADEGKFQKINGIMNRVRNYQLPIT